MLVLVIVLVIDFRSCGDSHFTVDALRYDQERTAHLRRFGIEVLRFTNAEISENLDGVLERIYEVTQERKATSP